MNITKLILLCLMLSSIATAQVTVYNINTQKGADSDPHHLTIFDGKLYLLAADSAHGEELWSIDTLTGELLVADINKKNNIPNSQGACAIFIAGMAVAYVEALGKDALFYIFDDGIHGHELFRYDGINPPVMIKEVIPGPNGLRNSCWGNMVHIKSKLYFYDETNGLWQYDINTGNTKLINNSIFPIGNDMPKLYAFKDKLYISNHHWYVYNTAADSLEKLYNIDDVFYIRVIGDKMYIIAGGILYQYDGTNNPKTIATVGAGYIPQKPDLVGVFKQKIYFPGPNNDIYEYDPVNSKTKKIAPSVKSGPYEATGFTEYRDKMYFCAYDSLHGYELWEWDGVNTPQLTIDLFVGSNPVNAPMADGFPMNFHVLGDGLYFVGTSLETPVIGREVHRYKPFPANVQNLSFKGEVRAYPNPTTSNTTLELQLHTAQTLYVELYNTEGRKVLAVPHTLYSNGTSRVGLDMRHLPVGNYFYHVRNKDNATVVSGKLVKL
jgi:ELWxxDGT repeat protein